MSKLLVSVVRGCGTVSQSQDFDGANRFQWYEVARADGCANAAHSGYTAATAKIAQLALNKDTSKRSASAFAPLLPGRTNAATPRTRGDSLTAQPQPPLSLAAPRSAKETS